MGLCVKIGKGGGTGVTGCGRGLAIDDRGLSVEVEDTKEAGLDAEASDKTGTLGTFANTISLLSLGKTGVVVVTTTPPSAVAGIRETTIPADFAAVSITSDGPGLTRDPSPSELCESSSRVM